MAWQTSHIFSVIRGKVGGTVYYTNPHHQICSRAYTPPDETITSGRQDLRDAFSFCASLWSSISESDRRDWNNYAPSYESGRQLRGRPPTGREVFLGVGTMHDYCRRRDGAATVFDGSPPTTMGMLGVRVSEQLPTPPGSNGINWMAYYDGSDPVDGYQWLTYPMAPTRKRYKGPWYPTRCYRCQDIQPTGTSIAYYGAFVGQRAFERVIFISRQNPIRRSAAFYLSGIGQLG